MTKPARGWNAEALPRAVCKETKEAAAGNKGLNSNARPPMSSIPFSQNRKRSMLDIALPSTSVKSDSLDSPSYHPEEAVVRAGQEAWGRLRSNATWNDWKQVGKAHVIGRHKAMIEAGVNQPIGRRYNQAFGTWQRQFGFENLDQGDRARLFEVMGHVEEIDAWLATLTISERLRLNHPTTVLRKWKGSTVVPNPNVTPKPSPQAKLKAANIELQEELHRLNRDGGGNAFTKNDNTKAIATAIIGTFDGLSNKTTKVEAIARELTAWVKQQKMSAQ
jgi:hypothetical protein